MRVKNILYEDFTNYKKPCMFIGTITCTFKCCIESGLDASICQNSELASACIKDVSNKQIIDTYMKNCITHSIVFGGLEPMLQIDEIIEFIKEFRKVSFDDVIIYTGYYKEEITDEINKLKEFDNIIIKYGRFIPNKKSRYDDVLGITLVSDNQYAEKIS